jgi:hypothetical protein
LSVRRLRTLREGGHFEADLSQLSAATQDRVYEVLRQLRTESELPGLDDVDELIPPAKPAGWRRPVPGTDVWIYYDLAEGEAYVALRSVGVPRTLSAEALEALEQELMGPPPTPYIRPVPDEPEPEAD